MGTLSSERFSRARHYLLTTARPLDRAMYQFEFDHASPDAVLAELRKFQNDDGGFGNALEPDFRLPFSSPLATTVALQYLSHLRLSDTPEMAVQAIQYLADTFDTEHQLWKSVPESVADFPRAVWWESPSIEKAEENWANPAAEIVGYAYEFPGVMPDELREALLAKACKRLVDNRDPLEMHDLLCYLRLAARLPDLRQADLYELLRPHVLAAVATTPDQWREYGLQPLQVASSPKSKFYEALRAHIDENLNFIIAGQGEDGAWNPPWQWWRYEEDWPQAQTEWKGVLTLDNLRVLRAYGRICE